jgi:hypothetical protein
MENPLALLVGLPALAVTLIALLTLMGVLFASLVQGTKDAAGSMPGRSTLLGFANVLLLSIISAALGSLGGGNFVQIVLLLILSALVIGLAFGLAGMAPLIGERLLPESSETRQTAWGAAVMLVASLTPFLGWFALFPYLAFRGLGAFVIYLVTRRSS